MHLLFVQHMIENVPPSILSQYPIVLEKLYSINIEQFLDLYSSPEVSASLSRVMLGICMNVYNSSSSSSSSSSSVTDSVVV